MKETQWGIATIVGKGHRLKITFFQSRTVADIAYEKLEKLVLPNHIQKLYKEETRR